MLSFIQLNLHRATQATVLLGRDLEGMSQTIACVTEPHTTANKVTGMPRGVTIGFDRSINPSQPPPRAAIIASRDLRLTMMDNWCNRDCAVATAVLHGRRTLIASIYLDILKPVVPQWLGGLVDMASNKGLPIIIMTDSNAHSCLYGPDNNPRGDAFEDFILEHGLEVQNVGDSPTFETQRGTKLIQTHIDVTLTRDLHFEIQDWRVDRSYNASDHNTIRFEAPETLVERTEVRPWSKADWNAFKEHLAKADYGVPMDMSMKKLDRLVARIYKHLNKAIDIACPAVTIKQVAQSSHWATAEHDLEKERVSRLYKQAKQNVTPENWERYKKADKAFKKMCQNDRNKAWRKYKESLQSEKDMASLAKMAQRQERRDINVLVREDGSVTEPGQDTMEYLTSTHFPAATEKKHVTYNNRRNCSSEEIEKKYTDWITMPLLKQALGGFEKKKSPGPDGIKPLVFEHLPDEFLRTLMAAYKSSIHLGYTPKLWRETKVIFISKPGKESYDKPKSFRPISLSNYFLKGLERLVGWNMDKALVHNPIHHKQHGFLTGKSTESAISNTTDYIEKFIMKKQHCVGVFLDISSAFDSIRPSHVRRALLDHGGDREMVQWYYNYITHRDIEMYMHGVKAVFSTGIGFPQGGVCSAKFWLIAFDYAIKILNTYNIEGNGYADDCSALYGGPRLDHAIARLQKMLDSLTAWGRQCGLKFNPEKSVAVVFTRRRKVPPKALTIDGKEIEYKQEVKYLGVTLDSKLHWKKHVDEKITKAKRYITKVACITKKNWGPKPKLMRWAYLGIVRPMLCYGAMVWGHRATHMEKQLRRINRMAINTMGIFPRSTPTATLEIMLDIMPLHLFCQQEAMKARVRLDDVVELAWEGKNDKKTHAISHLKYWEETLKQHDISTYDNDKCASTRWNNGFRINRDSFDGKARHRSLTQFNIYTDGSRKDDQTGSGYAIYKHRQEIKSGSHRLPDHATVFQAEITAIQLAAEALTEMHGPSITDIKFVKIFVDSQAAIQALGTPFITSRAVDGAINALNKLAERSTKITITWIPAHKGYFGNERADVLAKLGACSTDMTARVSVARPMVQIKNDIQLGIYRQWDREWKEDTRFKHSKIFYGGPDKRKAKYVYKLARLELGRFVRLITGHNNLNYFQTRIGLFSNNKCRFCEQGDETFIHFMTECPRLWQSRRDYFGEKLPAADMKWSVRSLIDFSNIPAISEAFDGNGISVDQTGGNAAGLDSDWDQSDEDDESTGIG